MIIAIPQLNYKAGDIQGNSEKIISAIQKAQNQKAELILFPELAVSGALPQDLLEREEFVNACRMAVEKIAATCTQIAAIVGAPNLDSENGIMYNSAYFIQNGEVVDGVHKNILYFLCHVQISTSRNDCSWHVAGNFFCMSGSRQSNNLRIRV